MPSLNTISKGGSGGLWSKKKRKPNKKLSNRERKKLKETARTDTLFGKRFR